MAVVDETVVAARIATKFAAAALLGAAGEARRTAARLDQVGSPGAFECRALAEDMSKQADAMLESSTS